MVCMFIKFIGILWIHTFDITKPPGLPVLIIFCSRLLVHNDVMKNKFQKVIAKKRFTQTLKKAKSLTCS